MRMDSEMNDISHTNFTPFMMVKSFELSDEQKIFDVFRNLRT